MRGRIYAWRMQLHIAIYTRKNIERILRNIDYNITKHFNNELFRFLFNEIIANTDIIIVLSKV